MLLAVPVLLPLIGGGAILILGREREERDSYIRLELLVEGLVLLNSLIIAWLIFGWHDGEKKFVLFKLYGDLKVMFKLDSMGSVFAGLIAFLWPLATLYSFEYMRHETRRSSFFAFYYMTYGVTVGIAFAGSLLTMYLFYEMLTLVTFPLVLFPMTKEAMRASRTYLYYSIGGAAFAFIGLVFVLNYSLTGNTDFVPGGVLDLAAAGRQRGTLLFVYVLAFFGFGVKAAVFPCHGWLPKATVAPTPVTALLHAVAVVKSGAFAILRFTYFSFGTEFLRGSTAQWVVMATAMVTIVFGSTMAVREVHWKRRLAYSTISNLSYILLGASMMSPLGLAAALSHMVFHAFMKICSFFCAGAVMHQTGKTYVYELDGLGKKMPVTFGCLTAASLSLMGIPLFAGFISKWNITEAAFSCASQLSGLSFGWLPYAGVAVILYSALMTGIYMLTVLIRAYFPQISAGPGGMSGSEISGSGIPGSVMSGSGIPGSGISGSKISGIGMSESKISGNGIPGSRISGLENEKDTRKITDPNWMMLVPLVIFAAAVLVLGLKSGPVMAYLKMIGGEAG